MVKGEVRRVKVVEGGRSSEADKRSADKQKTLLRKNARENRFSSDASDVEIIPPLSQSFQEVSEIKAEMSAILNLLCELEMEPDMVAKLLKARRVKARLQSFRKISNSYKEGRTVDRTGRSVTCGFKGKLREKLSEILNNFQSWREKIVADHKEDSRRSPTAEVPSDEMVDKMVSGTLKVELSEGNTELGIGDKVGHNAVKDILTELHQVFLDMEVLAFGNWQDLPFDLVEGIGKCLATREDVCSFRSVCKLWYNAVPAPFPVSAPLGKEIPKSEAQRPFRSTDIEKSLQGKKLVLIIHLDHILLNSTPLNHMTPEEKYLQSRTDSMQGSLFRMEGTPLMIKLRPFARAFLREVSLMFDTVLYTTGEQAHAMQTVRLLDPGAEYLAYRVMTHTDITRLDHELEQAGCVLILDDTDSVCTNHRDNLILIKRYHYFRSSSHLLGSRCKSHCELKTDESATEGPLVAVLRVLNRVHRIFFNELRGSFIYRDVRQVMVAHKGEVLTGCRIAFSHLFPSTYRAREHYLWRMAEELGASCSSDVDASVTHVVSLPTDAGTERSTKAVKNGKFLVLPGWLESAYYRWHRYPEAMFSAQ